MVAKSFNLQSKFENSLDQQIVVDRIKNTYLDGSKKQVLLGVTGSGKTYVMANLIKELNKPALILSHNKTLAAQLYEEFKEFFPDNSVKYFVSYYDYYQPEAYIPKKDLYIEKESEVNKQIEKLRFGAMNSAVTRRDTIVVASVSCIYNIGSPDNYQNHSTTLSLGDRYSIPALSRLLSSIRYVRQGEDFESGKYRIKGDVVDIFLSYEDIPVRIEFFGDEIERISYIDGLTGHKLKDLETIDIYPATSMVYEDEVLKTATVKILEDLDKRVKFLKNIGKDIEAYRLTQKTMYDVEMINEVGYCKSMENYSIYFDGRKNGEPPFTLLDYFGDDYLLMIDESHITIPQIQGMYNGDKARKDNLVEYGFRLPTARDNRPLRFDEFYEKLPYTLYVSATPNQWEIIDSNENVVELLTRPTGLLDPEIDVKPSKNQIDDVLKNVKERIEKNQRVLITTLTKKMAEDLASYIREAGVKVTYLHSDIDTVERVDILRDLRLGEYDVLVGINLLREGIDLPEVSLVLILDADKEGFLRSKTSLVQTVGRAARHLEGKVIMYGDKITESMKYAIDETNRRRKYQTQYNAKHGIVPKGITKAIRDKLVDDDLDQNAENYIDIAKSEKMSKKELKGIIRNLEDQMFIHAQNLQFEKAALLRDQINQLKLKQTS